jgi:K319-like protein
VKRYIAAWVGLVLLTPVAALAAGKDVELSSAELVELTGTASSCDDDGVLDTGESALVRVTLRNSGTERLEQTSMTLSSKDPDLSFPDGAAVPFEASEPGQSVTAELKVTLKGVATRRELALTISYGDEATEDKTHTVTYRVNTDELPNTSFTETVDALRSPWAFPEGSESILPWTRQTDSTGANAFFSGPANGEIASLALVSPPLEVSKTATFRVIFQHRYDFETLNADVTYDGAVIELSEDDGATWKDIGASVNPTYNATVNSDRGNPLKGQRAYGGQSALYPAFIKATANLGTTYAGKTVLLRFRIGTDESTGDTGWDLDDIQLEGVVNKPFTTVMNHRGMCLNRAPVATVKPVAAVNEGTRVTLVGSATDVNPGTTFSYTWTQLSSPEVTLSDSAAATTTFTAPMVDTDTTLTFQLVVSDGALESEPVTVSVLVKNVPNKLPVAKAGPDQIVPEGSGVTLNGSESKDPEGQALIYTWTQVGGPTVRLMPAGPRAMFNAPDVDEETVLTFKLQVRDAEEDSGEDTVSVSVTNRTLSSLPGKGCAAGPEGGVPMTALLLLTALGFAVRNRASSRRR